MTTNTAWWATDYPTQFYAMSNTSVTINGFPSVAWVDVSVYSSKPSWIPAASDMIAMTASEWSARPVGVPCYVDSGRWVAYPLTVTLIHRAEAALASARTYVSSNYTMLNESTPDVWVTYLKALMAIAGGADTTSTELPTAPEKI